MLETRTVKQEFYNELHFKRHLKMNRKTYQENESENKWPVYHYLTYNLKKCSSQKRDTKFRTKTEKSWNTWTFRSFLSYFENLIQKFHCYYGLFHGLFSEELLWSLLLIDEWPSSAAFIGFYFCVSFIPFPGHWILFFLSWSSSVSSEAISCPFNTANGVLFQYVLKMTKIICIVGSLY